MGFDQMNVLYNHYTVLRSRITATVTNSSTTVPMVAGVLVSGSSTVTTSQEQLVENGDCEYVALGFAGSMGSTAKLARQVNLAKFQGIDDVMDDPNMRGDSASNPAEQAYFHVFAFALNSATSITATFIIRLEYDVMFHEPRKGSLSAQRPVIVKCSEEQRQVVECKVMEGANPTSSGSNGRWTLMRS